MKNMADENTIIQISESTKKTEHLFSEKTFEINFTPKVENMDLHKNSHPVLPSEIESSADSHAGLIQDFSNLDLNDTQCLLDDKSKPDEGNKSRGLVVSKCASESCKYSVNNTNCKNNVEYDIITTEDSLPVCENYNIVELGETLGSASSISGDDSLLSNKGFSQKLINKTKEDLNVLFSEMHLNKMPPCSDTGTCGNKDGNNKSTDDLLDNAASGPTLLNINDMSFKEVDESNKHTSENFLDKKVCELTTEEEDGVLLRKLENITLFSETDTSHCIHKKSEISEIRPSENDEPDDDLIERGSSQKNTSTDQKEKKIIAGRAHKAQENAANYLKNVPNLHMSGGLIVETSPNKVLNTTNGYLNLVPFNDSSGHGSYLTESSMQVSSFPAFFDRNPINPVRQDSCSVNSYSFSTCENDNFLDDGLSLSPVLSANNDNSGTFMDIQNQSTVVLEAQNQKNFGSQQSAGTCDYFKDIFDYPSSVSSCAGHGSQPTSPESSSGYGSDPRFSPFSDDDLEPSKYNEKRISSSSITASEPNEGEFTDNWDLSIFDDFESNLSHVIQHTDEENKKINEIRQDLEKCEEVLNNKCDILPKSFNPSDYENSQTLCPNMNSSHLRGSSSVMHIPQQQQQSPVNVATQVPPPQVNTPVLVIYVPYAVNGTEKNSKPFKPIEPDPEGQRLLARSPKECLKEKLNRKKQMHYLYRITERLNSGDRNVIYIEKAETKQTNLHLAVIKQDLELAYCILEIHKKCSGDFSMVNCRDVYKKTALQYAIRNVMTVFVEYLKDYGAK